MVAFCSNAVGLRRCAGSNRDEFPPPSDSIIPDARHPPSSTVGINSNLLMLSGSHQPETTATRTGNALAVTFSYAYGLSRTLQLAAALPAPAPAGHASANASMLMS